MRFARRKNWILPSLEGNKKERKKKRKGIELGLLYILTLGTHSKFQRENNFLALGVCCPSTTKRVPHMNNRN